MIQRDLLSKISLKANNAGCTPSNCVAQCSPACSSDQVCVLGTMSSCGQCPASSCISKSLISGSSSSSKKNSNDDNGSDKSSLIGGLVGGLLGAGLVISAAGYVGLKYRQRKKGNTLPFTFQGKSMESHLARAEQPPLSMQQQSPIPTPLPSEQQQYTPQPPAETCSSARGPVMSGVIPIAYIPPSRDTVIEEQQQKYDSVVNRARQSHAPYEQDNPFSDAHSSVSLSEKRDSTASSVVVMQRGAPATQAYQVTRAKPQIMRVNTVRTMDGLNRSGSARTILTHEDGASLGRSNSTPARHQQSDEIDDDPFHDRHSTQSNGTTTKKTTDSVMSGPGDGEITIFWDNTSMPSLPQTTPIHFHDNPSRPS
ncbi:hypothetical protein BCR43DRAFT_25916 [Syncephalastrum racemosum]|uniref:Membrane anchor Opy2 N-terminal domain-containing protein n=1 Tax=Syncephalastrum racemosum TaxID=13706 RepID=A0A1X2HTG4_SYNRA|nr:hypothetical protein BCR43DRAFT_25916 [Syncephalastrum racemosum]